MTTAKGASAEFEVEFFQSVGCYPELVLQAAGSCLTDTTVDCASSKHKQCRCSIYGGRLHGGHPNNPQQRLEVDFGTYKANLSVMDFMS